MRNTNNDKITISLYSLQIDENFNRYVLNEIDNICKIKENFDREAKKNNRNSPEIVVSALLIPDWEKGSSYSDSTYQIAKNNFICALAERLNFFSLTNVALEDFYGIALNNPEYAPEKYYLQGLTHRNRNSDMIKTHSIIASHNRNRRHLQMDSNTRIHDFAGFYSVTFGTDRTEEFGVQLYACRYSKYFICSNNKVVYTTPNSYFSEVLKRIHLAYCATTEKHCIYYNSYLATLNELGLVKLVVTNDKEISEKGWRIYAALLQRPEYKLSAYIISAVNLLLRDPEQVPKYHSDKLQRFPSVIIGDASCDFSSFIVSIKRQTENLWLHEYDGKNDEFNDTKTRTQLFAISSAAIDKEIIKKFYVSACDHVTKKFLSENDFETIKVLSKIIPDNLLGNQLTLECFGCSVLELYENPLRCSNQHVIPELKKYDLLERNRMTREYGELTEEEIFYRDVYCQPNLDFQRILENQLGNDFSSITKSLEKNGIIALPQLFSGIQLQKMQQDFNRWCDGKVPDVHAHIQLGGSVEEKYFTDSPSMCNAVVHPLIWTLAAHMWGRDPVLSAMRAYRINPLPPKRYRAFQPHNDGHGKEFKVMLLLTDVKPGEQGMRYWQGTHNVPWQINSSRDTLYTDSETAQLGDPFECVGPAGTIFIFNINGIHSGVRNESATRDTLVFSITAGKRLYPIPPLHDDIISTLTDYEKGIFRCGRENDTQEIEGELPTQQSHETFMTYLETYSEIVKKAASHFFRIVESQSSTKFYLRSPFPAPALPVPITLTYQQTDIDALVHVTDQDLRSAISEDPKRQGSRIKI